MSVFVVKWGQVEIVDEMGDEPKRIAILGRGEFTGDFSQLIGEPSLVAGVSQGDCEAYEVSPDAVRHLLENEPELSDIMLRALVARRQFVRESGKVAERRVGGAQTSRGAFRVWEFLAKIGVAFRRLDLEQGPDARK